MEIARQLTRINRRRASALARRVVVRCSALLVALAFLLGIVRGGSQYFYCPMMDVVVAQHCCPPVESTGVESGPTLEALDCCQLHTIAALPSVDGNAPAPSVLAAPLVATLTPPRITGRSSLFLIRSRHPLQRAGPPPDTRSERAARLQVFLI